MTPDTNAENERDAEELLNQSKSNDKKTSEPAPPADSDDELTLQDAVAELYQEFEDGDLSENLTIRDRKLAALIRGYERTGRLPEVASNAIEAAGKNPADENLDARATALRYLLEYAIRDLQPAEDLEAASEGQKQYLMNQAEEF